MCLFVPLTVCLPSCEDVIREVGEVYLFSLLSVLFPVRLKKSFCSLLSNHCSVSLSACRRACQLLTSLLTKQSLRPSSGLSHKSLKLPDESRSSALTTYERKSRTEVGVRLHFLEFFRTVYIQSCKTYSLGIELDDV